MTRPSASPHSLHERALADIRYIRSAVENASEFTAVSGRGGVAMGVTGLFAAAVAATQTGSPVRWLAVWMAAAVVATGIGVLSMAWKSRRAGGSLVSAPARRFALAFLPAIAAAAALTLVLVSRAEFDLLPGIWLLLYGVAISAGGALSVRVVPFMGLVLLLTGAAALVVPFAAANLLLGLGFGVVQIGGGLVIIRRYGG
ncbi:MAG TPA: hypothetical protein VEK11_24645 [Thermoanaerobaculia bacterium]|nr:hypothetical protein [Thermoanaerobaculia bacterium]